MYEITHAHALYTFALFSLALWGEPIKVEIHDRCNSLEKCIFTWSWKHGFLCFSNNLLDHRFLLQCSPAHDASYAKGSKPSLCTFLQKHGGYTEDTDTLGWHVPTMKLQKLNILFSIQWFDVVNGVRGVRLFSLWPVQPVECAIFKLQWSRAKMRDEW